MTTLAHDVIQHAWATNRRLFQFKPVPPDYIAPTRAEVRIGLWPTLSNDHAASAMGLTAALAYLIESETTVVYRVFTNVDDSDGYDSGLELSQFDVDSWEIEGLDENVAVWGTLEPVANGFRWTIEAEDDRKDDVKSLVYEAGHPSDFYTQLPVIARDLQAYLGISHNAPELVFQTSSQETTARFLSSLFQWDSFALWLMDMAEVPTALIQQILEDLGNAAWQQNDSASQWLTIQAISRALTNQTPDTATVVQEHLWSALSFEPTPAEYLSLAQGFLRVDQIDAVFDTLERGTAAHPDTATLVMAQALVNNQQKNAGETIRLLQTAVALPTAEDEQLAFYGRYVISLLQQGMTLGKTVLYTGSNETNPTLHEAYEALKRIKADSDYFAQALSLRLSLLDSPIGAGEPGEYWALFEQLVKVDPTGGYVRSRIDNLQQIDDLDPGFEILEDAVKKSPGRIDLKVTLALLALYADQNEMALNLLDEAGAMTQDPVMIADIERLVLEAEDPEFESHLGEIIDLINNGVLLQDSQIDFLEEAVHVAPHFVEGYVLLAKGYQTRKDPAAAVETLLDGSAQNPQDAEIAALLARHFWSANEHDLAFDYLNKGLKAAPDDVPLLALSGWFLSAVGQDEAARSMLARAEQINPRDAVLNEARREIAKGQ